MSWKPFVIGDCLKIEEQAIFRIRHVDIDVSGPRTIWRAVAIVSGNGSSGAICCHWHDFKLCFWKPAEFFLEVIADLIQMGLVESHDLLAAGSIERAILADRVVEGIDIVVAHLLSDHQHFLFDSCDLSKADLVNLIRRHVRGRQVMDSLTITLVSLWNRPHTGL